MASILKVDTIQDQTGNNIINENSNTITIGKSGDTINIVGTLQNNGSALPGDISSVVAGTGLSGGGITGAVTLNIEAAQPTITSLGTITGFTSTGIDDNATSTAITIDSSERVGLGRTPTNAPFEIQTLATDLFRFVGNNSQGNYMRSGWYKSDNSTNLAFLNVDGDVQLTFGTTSATPIKIYSNNSERLRITSAGSIGIGLTNPDSFHSSGNDLVVGNTTGGHGMTIVANSTHAGSINFGDATNASTRGKITYEHSNDSLAFHAGGAEKFRVGANGNFSIGTTADSARLNVSTSSSGVAPNSFADDLFVESSGHTGITIGSGSSYLSSIYFANSSDNDIGKIEVDHAAGQMRFHNNGSERARFDASGNFFVATTTEASDDVGHALLANGAAYHTADGTYVGLFNRKSSNGEVVQIRKDDTTLGRLSVTSTPGFAIGTPNGNGSGLHLISNAILPSTSTGGTADNLHDLGASSSRFKDIYLGNSINLSKSTSEAQVNIRSTVTPNGSKIGGQINLSLGSGSISGSGNTSTQVGDTLGQVLFNGQGTDYAFQGGSIEVKQTTPIGQTNRTDAGCDMIFGVIPAGNTGYQEKLRIKSSGGITFNGDTSVNNALDDYEEGNFTPTWSGSSSVSVASGNYGYYTKIGNVVTVHFGAVLSSSSNSYYQITNAPFQSNIASGNCTGAAREYGHTGNMHVTMMGDNSTTITIKQYNNIAIANAYLHCSLTYRTD